MVGAAPAPSTQMKFKVYGWSLFDLVAPACAGCGMAHPAGVGQLCAGCEADMPAAPHDADVIAACAYAFPVDTLIQRLKFDGQLPLARPLGHLLAHAVRVQRPHDAPLPQALIPVPLHPARERQRGFNQAEAIARVVGRELAIPVCSRAVARLRNTSAQSGLDLEKRRRNLQRAFALQLNFTRQVPLLTHVAVIDDVVTTGSTLAALAGVLRAGGVRHIETWVVAKTL